MMHDKNLGEVLSELTVEHGVTLDKLSELTNIPKRYLSAMAANDEKNMPAAPYIKGYIAKIGTALGVDPHPLLEAYKKAGAKMSGKADILPVNRFALNNKRPKWTSISLIFILIIVIGILLVTRNYFLSELMGIPSIEVNIPNGDNFLETQSQFFTIEGKVAPEDSIKIRGELISVDAGGFFSKEVLLDPGINIFEIKAQRFLGRATTITRTIIYTPDKLNETNNININHGEEAF